MTTRLHLRSTFVLKIAASLLVLFMLLLLIPLNAVASSATIIDQAHVLNANQVRADGTKLPNALLVLTTATFTGDLDALNQDARQKLPNQRSIVIEIDTVHRNLSIQSGTSVKLSNDQASSAVDSFKSEFSDGGYTGATIAAIDDLHSSLVPAPPDQMTPLGKIVGVILLIAFIMLVVFMIRNYKRLYPQWGVPSSPYNSDTSSSHNYTHYSHSHNSWSSDSGGGSSSSSDGGSSSSFGGGAGGHF